MEVTSDLYTDEKLRLQAIMELMKEYRSLFPVLANYSLSRLWKKIKKYYDNNFCELHYLSDELEEKLRNKNHEQHRTKF